MGRTPPSKQIKSTDDILDLVLAFIEMILPGQHFLLAGEFYGGYLSRGVLLRKFEQVEGMALICPLIVSDVQMRDCPPRTVLVKNPHLIASLDAADAELFRSIAVVQDRDNWEHFRDEVLPGIRVADTTFLHTISQRYGYSFDVDHLPQPFAKPVVILTGRQDSRVGYRDAWQLLENYPRGTFAVLDRAGHYETASRHCGLHFLQILKQNACAALKLRCMFASFSATINGTCYNGKDEYCMTLQFGLLLPQGWTMDLAGIKDPIEAYETMTRVAQTAEEVGFASVWLVDHFHTIPSPSSEVTFECWVTTAALARDTRTIRIGQLVSCNSYRNPALLAKMASTVDVLSHGRLTFGIGAGWYEHEYRAYGYAYPDASERLRRLREAVQVILAMWAPQEEAQFEGHYYQAHGAINQPKGVQKPHIPLLIGGSGEKVTLKLVAQYADACNVGEDPATMKQKLAILKAHCELVGRDYESIHRTSTTLCLMADSDEQARALLSPERSVRLGDRIHTALIGSPETIRERLAAYEAAGVQELVLRFLDGTNLETLRRFAREFFA